MGSHADRNDEGRHSGHGHDDWAGLIQPASGHGDKGFPGDHHDDYPGFDLDMLQVLPWEDALLWSWSYSAEDIFAHGVLKTADTADAQGFYLITDIAGERNGERIIGLQPTGTAVPGNEPFAVDNLIRAGDQQLTGNGFGYALEDGTFANPFFADFLSPETYREFFSAPPFTSGIGPEDSEVSIDFAAHQRPHRPARPHDEPWNHRHHGGSDDWEGHGHSGMHQADPWFA
ncbi:hypothetical protein [Roseomonas populi]|uniref:Uncharacterized protein n=1 Tax=Roseomonas populi TaxID=3121582 RepID=A0ABT1X4F0_9PROT|nr:hypothetical protein [Roseomonas pecuniae]MCR0982599.1 hypothetical protein [Roseomonas pecuniae]